MADINSADSGLKVDGDNKDAEQFTPAERIRELIEIDADVAKLVNAAGLAVKTLVPPDANAESAASLEEVQEDFASHTNNYVVLSQSIVARLRRQIYALEEAGIISLDRAAVEAQQAAPAPMPPASNIRHGARTGTLANQPREPPMQITNGGLGKFDTAWLNSRTDRVGKQKEAELWAEARANLEQMLGRDNHTEAESEDGKDDMEVDDRRAEE